MLLHYDMATNIVRWMKTKLNGYKPFTVMPNEFGDSRYSDTELLLKSSTFTSNESFPSNVIHQRQLPQPYSTECLHQQELHQPNCRSTYSAKDESKSAGKRHLKFEELECDVSVEGCSPGEEGSRRQEFSFTLYDLDGHGKITKDDIAGLVKTIYETLGQSIKVPHYGSKTIKVKLTVSPEKKVCKNRDGDIDGGGGGGGVTSSPMLTKTREVSGGTPNKNKSSNDSHSSKTRERRYRQEQKFRRRRHSISSSGFSEDREADVSEDDDDEVLLNNKIHNPALISTGVTTIFSKYKRRSSSLQRQELLQIIQANMEKNNLCFQTSRKPTSNNILLSSQYRNRTKTQPFTRQCVNSLENHVQTDKCNTSKMFLNSFDPVKNRNSGTRRVHQRPQLYDLPNNHFAVKEEKKKYLTSHELKHRYRESEQARAKEQVIRWLEQEFSSPIKYCHNRKNKNLNNAKTSTKEEVKSKGRSCSNEKHEHHHIHEHHHYHHYFKLRGPIVV